MSDKLDNTEKRESVVASKMFNEFLYLNYQQNEINNKTLHITLENTINLCKIKLLNLKAKRKTLDTSMDIEFEEGVIIELVKVYEYKKLNDMCECCEKDECGNWISEPCCNNSGICESDATDKNDTIGNCIHCGGEMFKENDIWWHHTQEEIPIGERGTMHYGI